MDYYKIGQRIRKYRKAHGLSQEQLAEKIGISVTHMSHIETGNTKLSLQVFVDIAKSLEVQTDDLLFDSPSMREKSYSELEDVLENCSTMQIRIITDIAKSAKIALEKYKDSSDNVLK